MTWRTLAAVLVPTVLWCDYLLANDNLIAQKLYHAGKFAEAAEIYTDPAWKGVALYRSAQWWRAAEAFVRADDAHSYYNLGNTYVKLGYFALALDAYLAALAKQPKFPDASFNAELMRKLLAQDDAEGTQSGAPQRSDEIDRVESDTDESGNSGQSGEEEPTQEKKVGEDREGATDSGGPSPDAIASGDSKEAGSDNKPEDEGVPEGGSVKGTEAESTEERNPSGGSEGSDSTADAQAAGLRSELETAQATEQWLNQIKHDPLKYLQKRIGLELDRRRAAGMPAPEGGSQW